MIVSFDFDGTLADDFDGSINKQKEEIQGLALKYIKDGHNVCIITKRHDESNRNLGIRNEHVKVYELANRLGIKNIHFTNRSMKFSKIIELKIDIHFENSDAEIQLIKQSCKENNHKCITIPVEDPYWRNLVY